MLFLLLSLGSREFAIYTFCAEDIDGKTNSWQCRISFCDLGYSGIIIPVLGLGIMTELVVKL